MLGETDLRYRLHLAERFGCTLSELGDRLSYAEFVLWGAEDRLRASEREQAERLAQKGMRGR